MQQILGRFLHYSHDSCIHSLGVLWSLRVLDTPICSHEYLANTSPANCAHVNEPRPIHITVLPVSIGFEDDHGT